MLILHFPQFSRPLPPAPWPPFVCTECFSSRVRRSLFHSIILQPLAWLCRYRQRKTLFVCIERKIAFKCSLVVRMCHFPRCTEITKGLISFTKVCKSMQQKLFLAVPHSCRLLRFLRTVWLSPLTLTHTVAQVIAIAYVCVPYCNCTCRVCAVEQATLFSLFSLLPC